jgi:hypothetical protein
MLSAISNRSLAFQVKVGRAQIQGKPHADDDSDDMVNEAFRFRKLAKN